MHIKLKYGVDNFQFEHRKTRYLLQSSPVSFQPTLGEILHSAEKPRFGYGRVSLLALASRPMRIKKEYHISREFCDKKEYERAVVSGFEVQRNASTVARLLVKAGLAEVVPAEGMRR
jgi:hypothetical protein